MIIVCSTQEDNTIRALDCSDSLAHLWWMESSTAFLERLRAAGVTQGEIAKVLGIQQPNAATFYTPGKNGKLRQLKWDEGCKLAEAFKDRLGEPDQLSSWLSEAILQPIVNEIVQQALASKRASSARPLAEALSRYLQLLELRPSIRANQGALEAVALSVVSPIREANTQA